MHLINNVSRQGVGGRGKLKVTLKMIYDDCFAKRRYGGSGGLPPGQKNWNWYTRTIYVPKKMSVEMLRLFSDQNVSDFCLLAYPTILKYAWFQIIWE